MKKVSKILITLFVLSSTIFFTGCTELNEKYEYEQTEIQLIDKDEVEEPNDRDI